MMKNFKIYALTALAAVAAIAPASVSAAKAKNASAPAEGILGDVRITEAVMSHVNYMAVDMNIDLSSVKVPSNRIVVLTPWLINGNDSTALPAVALYGRTRYIQMERTGKAISGADEMSFRASAAPASVAYHAVAEVEPSKEGTRLKVDRTEYGCRNCPADSYVMETVDLGTYFDPVVLDLPLKATPDQLAFLSPKGEGVKTRSLSGRAYVDFPVSRTEIHPDYHNNHAELQRITATIDSVRSDADVTVKEIWIKGYASPESPYSNNERLASGRTQSLKQYVENLYNFPKGTFTTAYEPENWEGLREYVEQSNINHRDEILAIIDDTTLAPDPREWKLKTTYPEEYKFLHQVCYPYLRRSDYRIDYIIRSYSEPAEIARIMAERPQNLSLNEFYILANTYEPGSDAFNEVFETAVRMYPVDEVANLNAANTALLRGDLEAAERHLQRAGNSAEAAQAASVLAQLRENARLMLQAEQGE